MAMSEFRHMTIAAGHSYLVSLFFATPISIYAIEMGALFMPLVHAIFHH